MWPNPQFTADLLSFTEKILNCKLCFLCSDCVREGYLCNKFSKSKAKEFITLLSVISQKKRKQQKPRETCLQRIRKKFYYQQLKFMLLTKGTITVPMRSVMEAIARPSRKRLPLFYINSSPMHQIKIIH